MSLRRTMLFIPGNNPGMLQTATVFGSDTIILDLEDAVALTEKDAARILVKNALKTINYSGVEVIIRINPLTTPYANDDIDLICPLKPDTILLPKADPESIKELDTRLQEIEKQKNFPLNSIKIMPLIETTYGVENVYETIKASSRVVAAVLGGEDLAVDLGIKRTRESKELFYARSRIINACKALKIDAIDTPFTDTNDYEGLKLDVVNGKMLGFNGKLVINPRQIDVIHKLYAPTPDEINYARKVIMARDEAQKLGQGVFSLNGKMVDLPIINRAINTLNLAKLMGLLEE